jgi:hypothetical protein
VRQMYLKHGRCLAAQKYVLDVNAQTSQGACFRR